ncbi:murein L,D-transpeptidase [uncultured Hymenobacter sp.]|uniref:L,D-transpeptidase family protein n=1 Tax=uncultured Hymenobacter sp. TaxID=170016 RepID=UPI0035CC210F
MSFFSRYISLLTLLLASLLSLPMALVSCGTDQGSGTAQAGADLAGDGTTPAVQVGLAGDPDPRLDSVYIIRQMQAEPSFKDQTLWARKFYRERQFRLGWFRHHQLVPQAQTMLSVIAKAKDEGLDPKDYQVKDFTKLFASLEQVRSDTTRRNKLEREIDVALSGTYFNWASDFYRGLANPRDNKGIAWDVKHNKIKLHHALMTILRERESTYPYYEFAPLHPEYDQLKKALAGLREQQAGGGWPVLPATTKLKPGTVSAMVPLLRQRLMGSESPASVPASAAAKVGPAGAPTPVRTVSNQASAAGAEAYGPDLVAAVKSFQQDAGLKADGLVGGETLRQLNVPIDERIDQVILNMERWRWLPKRFEPNYLLVNIPEYKLHVVEQNKEVMSMNVIVGKVLNETPVFSDKLEYVVLSPYWNVPYSIIDKELRDKLIADPSYLDRLDMEVVKGSGRKAVPVDPASIDWAGVTDKNFKYTVRRRPGPKNDLGDVKFIFPNSNDIYLHDTPHDQLFAQAKRDFSHGCVRVEEPIKLATYLLRDKPNWDKQTILDTIAVRREKYVLVKEKLPVYLVYFTAWATPDGRVHFRDDIYGHDKTLAREYFN